MANTIKMTVFTIAREGKREGKYEPCAKCRTVGRKRTQEENKKKRNQLYPVSLRLRHSERII